MKSSSRRTPEIVEMRYPVSRLSRLLISLIYPKNLRLRIGQLIGKKKTVFEIVAGYSRFVTFFDPSNLYGGIDINPVFLGYREGKGKGIRQADVFDADSYIESDVVLLLDVVHHLEEDALPEIFDLVFAHAREKVLVVEPAFPTFSRTYGLLGKALDKTFLWLDNDGFTTPHHWFTPAKYQHMFRTGFGSPLSEDFTLHYEKLAHHHIALYQRVR